MTGKRFILTEQFNGLQGVTFVKDECVTVDTYYTVDGAVDLMNELNDENEQLKRINKGQELEIVRLHKLADAMSGALRELGVYDVYDKQQIENRKKENKLLKEKLNDILELTEQTGMIHLRKAEIKNIINR